MLAQKKPIFDKVVAVVKKFSADEQARMEYDKHELWRMDYSATMKNAARRGHAQRHAQGHAEGKAEEKTAIAQSMKAMGLSKTVIAKATGLSPAEIEQLD